MLQINQLENLHDWSKNHRAYIEKVKDYVCYHCLKVSNIEQVPIKEWIDEDKTALCPHCGIDSILPVRLGNIKLTKSMVVDMNKFWFSRVRQCIFEDGKLVEVKEI